MSTATRCAISRTCIAGGLLLLIAAALMAGREPVLAVTTGLCGAGAIGGASVYLRSVRRRRS